MNMISKEVMPVSESIRQDLDALVREVNSRGLQSIASLFIEMYRPLAGVAQALWIAGSPVVLPLIGGDVARRIGNILENPQSADYLEEKFTSEVRDRSNV